MQAMSKIKYKNLNMANIIKILSLLQIQPGNPYPDSAEYLYIINERKDGF